MSTNCVNTKNTEFIKLQEESGLRPALLAAEVGAWMDKNGNDRFPTADELDMYLDKDIATIGKADKKAIIDNLRESGGIGDALLNFLDTLNFTAEFGVDIANRTGFNASGATDLLYKAVMIKSIGIENATKELSNEVAYVAYSMLGKKNKTKSALWKNIENHPDFLRSYNDLTENSKNLSDGKLKELIIVDLIAKAINKNYKSPNELYNNAKSEYWGFNSKNKLDAIIKYQISKIVRFLKALFRLDILSPNEVEAVIDDIASDVLVSSMIKYPFGLSKEDQLTNYENTLAKSEAANDIINRFAKAGAMLTGSLALRDQGSVYRENESNIHDLDFTVSRSAVPEYMIFDIIENTFGMNKKDKFNTISKMLKNTESASGLYEMIGSGFKFTGMIDNKKTLTIQGKIGEFHIDLFFNKDTTGAYSVGNNSTQDWMSIFRAKLSQLGRYKDLKDFVNYIPFAAFKGNPSANHVGLRHFTFGDIENNTNEPIANVVEDNDLVFQKERPKSIPFNDSTWHLYRDAGLLNKKGEVSIIGEADMMKKVKENNSNPNSQWYFNHSIQGSYPAKGGGTETRYRIFLANKPEDENSRIAYKKDLNSEIIRNPTEFSAENGSESDFKAYSSDERTSFKSFVLNRTKYANMRSKQGYRVAFEMARELNRRFGTTIVIKPFAELDAMFPGKLGKSALGFFSKSRKTSFLIEERFNAQTSIHEAFTHPFLYMIKDNPEYPGLYESLLAESSKNKKFVAEIKAEYADHTDTEINDEIIANYLDIVVGSKMNNTTVQSFYKAIMDFIKKLFKVDSSIDSIKPTATISQIADFVLYGNNKMSIIYGDEARAVENALDNNIQNDLVDSWQMDFVAPDVEIMKAAIKEELNSNVEIDSINRDLDFRRIVFSRYTSYQNHQDTNVKFDQIREVIASGLRSQAQTLNLTAAISKAQRDELSSLINTIEGEENESLVLLKYLKHAHNEMGNLHKALDLAVEAKKRNEYIDSEFINTTKATFIDMHDTSTSAISRLLMEDNKTTANLTRKDRETMEKLLSSLLKTLDTAKKMFSSIDAYAYGYLLREEAARSGDKSMTDVVSNNLYSIDKDSGFLFSLFGIPSKARVSQTKALVNVVTRANETAVVKFKQDEDIAELISIVGRMKKGAKKLAYTTFRPLYELNGDGKKVGYLNSDLKYGEFLAEYRKFLKGLEKEFNIKNPGDKPTNENDRISYLTKLNKFLDIHTERMFTAEYYKLRNSFSKEAIEVMDAYNIEIRKIMDKYKNPATGKLELNRITDRDYYSLVSAKMNKAALANPVSSDGEYKIGLEKTIADEIQKFNAAVKGKIEYKVDQAAFNAEYARMKAIGANEAAAWYAKNTRKEIDQSFYDEMEELDRSHYSEEYKEAISKRSAFLRRFRHPDLKTIMFNMMDVKDFETVKILDEEVDEARSKNSEKEHQEGEKEFEDFAVSYISPKFKEALEAATRISPQARANFLKANTFDIIDYNGKIESQVTSVWKVFEPKDANRIKFVPNFAWSTIDSNSEFYNNKFDESKADNGYQPKRSLYDNSEAMRKIRANKDLSDLYGVVLRLNKKSNEKYYYMQNPSPYRIAQVGGSTIEKLRGSDGFFKSLGNMILDIFSVEVDDVDYGLATSSHNNPDGSKIRFIKTAFKAMLRDPATISDNLPMITAALYAKALQFEELSKVKGDAELMKRGIKNTRFHKRDDSNPTYHGSIDEVNKIVDELSASNKSIGGKIMSSMGNLVKLTTGVSRDVVADGTTNSYTIASKFLDAHLYGEKNVLSGTRKHMLGRKLALEKVAHGGLRWASAVNLVGNVPVIMGNYLGAMMNLGIEAHSGYSVTKKSLAKANKECFLHSGRFLVSLVDETKSDKILSLMGLLGVSGSATSQLEKAEGISALNFGGLENIAYIPYSVGDFVVKAQLTVAFLLEHKEVDGKFVSRSKFMLGTTKENKKARLAEWNSIQSNLYDAFEISKETGAISLKKEFKGKISDEELAEIGRRLDRIAKKTDGAISQYDKATASRTVLGAALTMHRGFLIMALSDRLQSPSFSYEQGEFTEGMYQSFARNGYYKLMEKFGKSIPAIEQEMRDSNYRRYNLSRMSSEFVAMMFLAGLAVVLSNIKYDEDEEEKRTGIKDIDVIDYAYLANIRLLFEMNAVYMPWDTFAVLKDPIAAQTFLGNAALSLADIVNGKEADRLVQSGPYKGETVRFKNFMKATPMRATYEFLNSDSFDQKTDFMENNTGILHWIAERLIGSKNLNEKRRKADKKQALLERKLKLNIYDK